MNGISCVLSDLANRSNAVSEVSSMTIDELGIKRASAYKPTFVIPFYEVEVPVIIDYVDDKRPTFDGDKSLNKLKKWIEDNLRYPEEAKNEGIQGRILLSFTITKDGRVHIVLIPENGRITPVLFQSFSDCNHNFY